MKQQKKENILKEIVRYIVIPVLVSTPTAILGALLTLWLLGWL